MNDQNTHAVLTITEGTSTKIQWVWPVALSAEQVPDTVHGLITVAEKRHQTSGRTAKAKRRKKPPHVMATPSRATATPARHVVDGVWFRVRPRNRQRPEHG